MAFIDDNDEENPGQGPLVGGGSNAVGTGGVSQAGTGAGGGGWTNIQAYLKANEGNTQSANALNKDVGSQFDQEQNSLTQASQSAKGEADKNTSAPSLDDAMYGGSAADSMRNYLNGSYSGPRTFDYGVSGKTQTTGDALGNRDGFQGLMQGLYNRSAGGAMTTGQRSLQQQLDVNNPQLAQTQNDLSGRYNQLKSLASQTAKDTSDYLGGAESRYKQGQTDMRGNITTRANDAKSQWDALEAQRDTWQEAKRGPLDDAIAPYKQQYNTLQSFLGGGQANPADGPKQEIAPDAQPSGAYMNGDHMVNAGETVDPYADQWTTITKKKNPLASVVDAGAGWVAPATNFF